MRFGILISCMILQACGEPEVKPPRFSGSKNSGNIETPAETEARLLSHFKIESTVDATAQSVIKADLKRLANWTEDAREEELAKLATVSGLKTVNAQELATWLTDRVTYMSPATGGTMEVGIVKVAKQKIVSLAVPGAPKDGIVAANLGPQIYEAYRVNKNNGADGIVWKFDGKWVDFLGLRTGVIQLGASTFSSADTGTDAAGESLRIANSIFRLSALFHEARHSDGNNASSTLGLLHAACPADGSVPAEYAGALACDSNANGPYTVGAHFVNAVMGLCESKCAEKEKTTLQAVALDFLARVVAKTDVDASAEANLTKVDTSMFEVVASGG